MHTYSIGFTGTRNGLTVAQLRSIQLALSNSKTLAYDIVHHGVCIGADEQFHYLAKQYNYYTIGHPGVRFDGRCFTRSKVVCDSMLPEKEFIPRNHDIVNASSVLYAAPKDFTEKSRSGTWATVRYARVVKKTIYIFFPDGTIKVD